MAQTLRVDSRREIPEGHGAALLVLALVRLIERRNRQRVAAKQMELDVIVGTTLWDVARTDSGPMAQRLLQNQLNNRNNEGIRLNRLNAKSRNAQWEERVERYKRVELEEVNNNAWSTSMK